MNRRAPQPRVGSSAATHRPGNLPGRFVQLARRRPRLLICLVWPVLLGVATVSVVHFLRYRLGVDVYWTWEAKPTLATGALLLIPIVAYEAVTRWGRIGAAVRHHRPVH